VPTLQSVALITEKPFRVPPVVSVATFGYSESNHFGKLIAHVIAAAPSTSVPNNCFQDDACKATLA
jgi:hypothetical protein